MKHTPTPWKLNVKQEPTSKRNVYEHGESFKLLGRGKSVFGIATIDGPSNFDMQDELRANAEFICRACNSHEDLLEACKFAFENLRPQGNIKKDFSGHNAMATLSRVIAKATN